MKCVLSKRTCLGYSDTHPRSAQSRSSESASPGVQHALAYVSSSPDEQRALQYFREQTAPQLCCYNDSELWTSTILQVAQTDSCIRHAVIALSSFHEIFTLRASERQTASAFALQHYNSAIRHQIHASTGKAVDCEQADRYMTASILFVCIELLQDHYVSAFSLLSNAIKLVSASSRPERKSSAWPRKTVEAMYNRLQFQAFGLLGPSIAVDMDIPGVRMPAYPSIPSNFSSIAEARLCLEDMICRFTFAQSREEQDVLVRCADLVEGARMMMSCWSSAFQDLLDRIGDNLSWQDEQAKNVLQIWQLRAIGTLEAAAASSHLFDTKSVWDSLVELGYKIVSLAESVVANAETSASHTRRAFTLDHGVVEPMMSVALVCRDPALRRRATNVLRRYHNREGLYDSALVTCVIERATQIEEAAVPHAKHPSDVPEWARLDSILPTFQFGDRHVVFHLTRQQQGISGRTKEVFEEVVSW